MLRSFISSVSGKRSTASLNNGLLLKSLARWGSNLSKLDTFSYEQRVEIVTKDHDNHYPLIDNIRDAAPKLTQSQLLRIPQFKTNYQYLTNEQSETEKLHLVEGRITRIRKSGKKLVFLDIIQDFQKLQVVYSLTTIADQLPEFSRDDFVSTHEFLKIGDGVSIKGIPFRTKSGELSIRAYSPLKLLSNSLIPVAQKTTIDIDSRYPNYKVCNMIMQPQRLAPLVVKSLVTNSMRDFLINKHQFIEVETPIIANTANGANANPFVTQSEHMKGQDLTLRIAPELFLKKLIVGGFDKVFEIGRVFRNEGIDSSHNPEFTTCEFYQSYTDLNQLIELTEDMLVAILNHVREYINNTGNIKGEEILKNIDEILAKFNSQQEQKQEDLIINNDGTIIKSRYFKLVEFIPAIEKVTKFPLPEDLNDIDSLKQYFQTINLPLPLVISVPSLLNTLASEFVESHCAEPSLIINHPAALSPLSKCFTKEYGTRKFEVANRFEMFINEREYMNAYEEENSPFKQSLNFQNQLKFKEASADTEIAMIPDVNFIKALEYGMPPTGGWGCGIDRLTMLICGVLKIGDVLSFGNLKDVIRY